MELRDYLRVLRQGWWVILILALAGGSAGYGYSLLQTPVYSSSAKVFISTSGGDTIQALAQGNTFSQQRVKTYSDLATTRIVLQPVIDDLRLNTTSPALAGRMNVAALLNTAIIDITVNDSDPALAAKIANEVSSSLATVVTKLESPTGGAATGGTATVSPVTLTLVDTAVESHKALSPNVLLNTGLGGLAGLLLGMVLVVLREVLDVRIRNERDVKQITDIAVIGGIAFDPKVKKRPLIVHIDPRSPRVESFRALRMNLDFVDIGRTGRSFVMTSSIQSEGKSTTAANLAIALSDSGARVLLVDADLRRPAVAGLFGIEGAVGLTDLLIGRASWRDVIQPWGQGGLSVLPAGGIPPNPSELLGSTAMAGLVTEFSTSFDVVIFDAPPLLPVTDAAILARIVGGAIVLAAVGRTHKNQLKSALAVLAAINVPASGVVLSMLAVKGSRSEGRYGYGYAYTQKPIDTVDFGVKRSARPLSPSRRSVREAGTQVSGV